ncbi:unnamed protein product [Diamesa serratosioi]
MAFSEVPLFQSNVIQIPNKCGVCDKNHYTGNCTTIAVDQHIQDKPIQNNLSRYSVPDGLLIMNCDETKTSFVITTQKFAKGTRFGPVLAPKSYFPPASNTIFPLVIFNDFWNGEGFMNDLSDDIKELFTVKNYYLDTSDENNCNWMIHVDIAKFSNEQNLICYQENDQIYYTSTRDIELGDILKVWYAPSYAKRMGMNLLDLSNNNTDICTNLLRQVSFDYGIKLNDESESDMRNNNYLAMPQQTKQFETQVSQVSSSPSSEITLPPINSLMKNQSPNYNQMYDFDNLILMAKNEQSGSNYSENFFDGFQIHQNDLSGGEQMNMSPDLSMGESEKQPKPMKFTEMNECEAQKFACELCNRKYITKSNLEKHMRSHDLFMCVVCMKMFNNPEELREHDCFKQKTTAKKSIFHCGICWKVLSNSWSLNRHMKIHRNTLSTVQEKTDDILDDFLMPQAPEMFNDIEQLPEVKMEEPEESFMEQMPEPMVNIKMENIQPVNDPLEMPNNNWLDQNLQQTPPPQQHQHFDKCVVCARVFKNPNSLEKHLRNTHTAHVIRPELTTSIKKSSEYRRIVLNNTKPIKENVAKALASKLNKKNLLHQTEQANSMIDASLLEEIQKQEHQNIMINDIEYNLDTLTPIGGIKGKSNGSTDNGNTIIIISNVELTAADPVYTQNLDHNQMFPNTNGYKFDPANTVLPKLVPIGGGLKRNNSNVRSSDVKEPGEMEEGELPKCFIIDKSNESIPSSSQKSPKIKIQSPESPEQHNCEKCDKIFQKKYQLKRHMEIHENLFYFCPFCKRAPVKARSSLRKHFMKDHPESQEIWQTNNFMSKLLKKHEKVTPKVKLNASQSNINQSESPNNDSTKKPLKNVKVKTPKVKKPPKVKKSDLKKAKSMLTSVEDEDDNGEIINDEPLPQSHELDDNEEQVQQQHQQQQQIILHNLFLDPITLDEENNLIKYTLAADDDFIMNGHNHSTSTDTVSTINNITHSGSIESYEMSEFSNFKSSFDEIQEKLDAELEFNNDQMIKWTDELNDDDDTSSQISSSSQPSALSSPESSMLAEKRQKNSLTKAKKIENFMLT